MSDDDGRPTIEVEIDDGDGGTRTVQTHLPDGYLHERDVRDNYVPKETVEQRILDRIRRAKSGLKDPDELLEDEDFIRRVARERRDTVLNTLGIDAEGRSVELERAREAWERENVAPLREELERRETRLEKARHRIRDAEIERAASKYGVRDSMRDVLPAFLRDRVAYDEESDNWYVVNPDGEGFEYTSRSSERRSGPYKTIDELVEELANSEERADWFEARGRQGAGFQNGDRRRGAGPVTLEDFESMTSRERRSIYDRDPGLYSQLMDELAERNRQAYAEQTRRI